MINEARSLIFAALGGLNCSVYNGQADEDAQFPYAIYDFQTVSHDDFVHLCELEVNIVDYGRSTAAAETLCDNLIKIFDHKFFENTDVGFYAYYERKNNVMDEDRNIIRRRVVFSINLYERN